MFVAFEGCDGSGKTTQAKLLADYLNQKGIDCFLTREPGCDSDELCKALRKLVLRSDLNITPRSQLHLMIADHNQNDQLIYEALRQNKVVVSDRCFDSIYIYQGFYKAHEMNLIHHCISHSVIPDLTIYLNSDSSVIYDRIINRKMKEDNIFDKSLLNFLSDIVEYYESYYSEYKYEKYSMSDNRDVICLNTNDEEFNIVSIDDLNRSIIDIFEKWQTVDSRKDLCLDYDFLCTRFS